MWKSIHNSYSCIFRYFLLNILKSLNQSISKNNYSFSPLGQYTPVILHFVLISLAKCAIPWTSTHAEFGNPSCWVLRRDIWSTVSIWEKNKSNSTPQRSSGVSDSISIKYQVPPLMLLLLLVFTGNIRFTWKILGALMAAEVATMTKKNHTKNHYNHPNQNTNQETFLNISLIQSKENVNTMKILN